MIHFPLGNQIWLAGKSTIQFDDFPFNVSIQVQSMSHCHVDPFNHWIGLRENLEENPFFLIEKT